MNAIEKAEAERKEAHEASVVEAGHEAFSANWDVGSINKARRIEAAQVLASRYSAQVLEEAAERQEAAVKRNNGFEFDDTRARHKHNGTARLLRAAAAIRRI